MANNKKYYIVGLLANLPASSANDGDLYFVKENKGWYVWDETHGIMSKTGNQLPIAESDVTGLVSDLAVLASGIVSEASTRASADSAESTARLSADATLQTNINAKQDSLGYTAEDSANKDTDSAFTANSDTKYPSQKAVKTALATKQNSLGYTAEDSANKDTSGTLASNSDTKYPSQKAVKTYVDAETTRATTAEATKPTLDAPGLIHGTLNPPGFTMAQITPVVNCAASRTVLYTVPTGYKAWLYCPVYNSNAGAVHYKCEISKDGGTTWILATQGSVTLNTGLQSAVASAVLLEAGDKFSITPDAVGLNITGVAQLFLSTSGVKQLFFTAFASGDNVVYTVPPNTRTQAFIGGAQLGAGAYGEASSGQAFISNVSGASVTCFIKFNINSTSFKIGQNVTIANNADGVLSTGSAGAQFGVSVILNAGDQIIVNSTSSTAGQALRTTIYEWAV
jgi:hypothetical protein